MQEAGERVRKPEDLLERREVIEVRDGGRRGREELLVREEYLGIWLNDRKIAVLVMIPEKIREAVLGFLITEGYLEDPRNVRSISIGTSDVRVLAEIEEGYLEEIHQARRDSDCFSNVMILAKDISSSYSVSWSEIVQAVRRMQDLSRIWRKTGGTHAAMIVREGEIAAFAEDVSRHTAIDKVIGESLMKGVDLSRSFLVTSGRISREVVLKCSRVGIPIVASRAAPMAQAVELADDIGMTLVGFARGRRIVIYTHPERIRG